MKAIVFGANGYLGSAIVKHLLEHDVHVLGIARQAQKDSFIGSNRLYCHVLGDADNYENLIDDGIVSSFVGCTNTEELDGNIVFYNAVWRGETRLRDGTLEDQFRNVVRSSNAVKFASRINCKKYINISSQEEMAYQYYIDTWKADSCKPYPKSDLPYASAKLAAKQICLIESYLNKIDFVNTRFSVILDQQLNSPSFIAKNLKKIRNGEECDIPSNNSVVEINKLDDIAEAYYYVGMYGKNKGDYYLGQGYINSIKNYFDMAKILRSSHISNFKDYEIKVSNNIKNLYDNTSFLKDTGFCFNMDPISILKDIIG